MKALHYYHTKPPSKDHSIPITRETAVEIATPPNGLDQALWLYELCRFLINKCNDLIIGFLFDDPPCSAHTCPEMRASEWQFLCAVHESPKGCCAIDYCCHTLDWATNIVTSQKIFPSRLSMAAGDAMDDRGAGVKHLINIFRRLHRIFAHAWFQHRGVFWQVEGQTGLYVLFKTVCDMHELLPPENYKLPPEAEGLENVQDKPPAVTSILKTPVGAEEDFLGLGRQNTTRRHVRQSPSVGSAITTVQEIDEEEGDISQRLRDARNSRIAEEEGEDGEVESDTGTEIPVIVETFEEVDPGHDTEPAESNGGIVKDEEPSSETIENVEPEQEDSETVIHDDDSKAGSTGSWDSMSGDSVGDKTEADQENGDAGEDKPENGDSSENKPETVVKKLDPESVAAPPNEVGNERGKGKKSQEDYEYSSGDDCNTEAPMDIPPPKKSKKSRKKAKKSAAAKEASKTSTSTNHINDDTNTTDQEKISDQDGETGVGAEDQKA